MPPRNQISFASSGSSSPQLHTDLWRVYFFPGAAVQLVGMANNAASVSASELNGQMTNGPRLWDFNFPTGFTGNVTAQVVDVMGTERTLTWVNPGGAGGRVQGDYAIAEWLSVSRSAVGGAASPTGGFYLSHRMPVGRYPFSSVEVYELSAGRLEVVSQDLAKGWVYAGDVGEGNDYALKTAYLL